MHSPPKITEVKEPERESVNPGDQIVQKVRRTISGVKIRSQLEYRSIQDFLERNEERYWNCVVKLPEMTVQKKGEQGQERGSWVVPNKVMDDANISTLLKQCPEGVDAFRYYILGKCALNMMKVSDDSTKEMLHIITPIIDENVETLHHPILNAQPGDKVQVSMGHYYGGNTVVVYEEGFENLTLNHWKEKMGLFIPDLFDMD